MFSKYFAKFLFLLILSKVGYAADVYQPNDESHEGFELTILHTNDHHSHLKADNFSFDVSDLGLSAMNASGKPVSEVVLSYGGYPLLTQAFSNYERKLQWQHKNYVKVHAGDAITGSLYYTLFKGEADAAMMNEICFDVFAVGNHEFDDGDQGLANFLTALNSGTCDTAVLSANLVLGPDSPAKASTISPYTIKRFGQELVGFVGLTSAQKTKVSSRPDPNTEFLDETQAAQAAIDALRQRGVNKVVLVTHITYQGDLSLAQRLKGVDVIVGGDSHSLLGDESLEALGFTPVGPYPSEATDQLGNKVCVVQAWEYARLLGVLTVSFDSWGRVKSCQGKPVIPVETDNYAYQFSEDKTRVLEPWDSSAVNRALWKTGVVQPLWPDYQASQRLAAFDQQVDALEQRVIGTVADDLCLTRFPGQGHGTPACEPGATSVHGSDISNIVAKAFLTVTPTADFAIQNAGGVREYVPAGEYTVADAYTLLPFSNTLVTLDVSGKQIKAVLEDALANTLDAGGSSGSYPYAAGLRFHVDASARFGSRISKLEINPRLAGPWQPIDPETNYTVVTNDFIASGRDGYRTFGVVFDAGNFVNTYTEYAQGFINYVKLRTSNNEMLSKLPVSEYSTQNYTGRDGCVHSTPDSCSGY